MAQTGPTGSNLLLTGPPGVGKTTLIRKVIEPLDIKVGGFWTEEIRSEGRRVGFRITSNVGEDVLAHVNSPSPFRVAKYGVNVSAFERVGVAAIEEAVADADLIVMDELGRMELFSKRFQEVALRALDSPKPVLGVIQNRADPFLDSIRARSDVAVVRVTPENRGLILDDLTGHLSLLLRRQLNEQDPEANDSATPSAVP